MADRRHFENCSIAISQLTSSSAVAKRPRDALCLSVVSFNNTKHRVESFIARQKSSVLDEIWHTTADIVYSLVIDFSEILYEKAKRHADKSHITKTSNFKIQDGGRPPF